MKIKRVLFLTIVFLLASVFQAYALTTVQLSPSYFPEANRGRPIANGKIYVGLPDTDPEVVVNQKTLSVLQEDGSIIAVSQPIYTSAGGIPVYSGSPVTLLVDGNYSLKVLNSYDVQAYYIPSVDLNQSGNYYPDYTATDQGITGDSNTVKYYVDTISTDLGTIVFQHNSGAATTTYTFETSETIPSNINIIIEKGAILSTAAAQTLTINGPFDAGLYQVFSGAGSVAFGATSLSQVYPEWWTNNIIPGTTDMSDALNAAGAQTIGELVLSSHYKISKKITSNIPIRGIGTEQAIIDAYGATLADWPVEANGHRVMIEMTGIGLTAIPDVNVDIVKGIQALTFASTPSISEGDVIIIYNPTDSSYSGFRTYYRAGEYARIKSVSGTTVELMNSIVADYTAATVDLYVISGVTGYVKDFTIRGIGDSTGYENALLIKYGIDFTVSGIKLYDYSYSGINIKNCFNIAVNDCISYSNVANPAGNIYPYVITNSQNIKTNGGYYSSYWHAISPGGGSDIGCVPNRYLSFDGVYMTSTGNVQAFGPHGNMEYLTINNCTIDGGYIYGGNHTKLTNCDLIGKARNGGAIRGTELSGLDHEISNSYIYSNLDVANYGNLIDLGGGAIVLGSDASFGGTLKIIDNVFEWDISTTTMNNPFVFYQRGYTGSEAINIQFNGNTMLLPSGVLCGTGVFIRYSSGNLWGNINIKNNVLNCGINISSATDISTSGNSLVNCNRYGVYIGGILNSAFINDNYIENTKYTAIYIQGSASNHLKSVNISNNIAKDVITGSTTSANGSFIAIIQTANAIVQGNIMDTDEAIAGYLIYASSNVERLIVDKNYLSARTGYSIAATQSNITNTIPTKGKWMRGDRAWNYQVTSGGIPGWLCIYSKSMTMRIAGASADTILEVTTTTNILAGDVIGIILDDGTTHWTSITSITDADTLVITAGLPSAAGIGAVIYTNRWKAEPVI